MSARAGEVQRGTVAYSSAQQLLRRAEQELGSALKALSVTQISGATETIQDVRIGVRGGGMFGRNRAAGRRMDRKNDFAHNAIETATVHKANKMMKQAASDITQAKQHVPQLPFIEMANVSQAMGGVFFNALLAPGLIGDMIQRQKVNKAKSQTQEMANQTKQALDCMSSHVCPSIVVLSPCIYIFFYQLIVIVPFLLFHFHFYSTGCGNNMNAANAEMAQLNGSLQAKQSELASLAH